MHRLVVFLLAALAPAMSGCGTALNFMHGKGNAPAAWEVYGGVRADTQIASALVGGACHPRFPEGATAGEKSIMASDVFTCSFFFAGCALVDLPLSAVADTLTLPLTIPAAIDRAVYDFYFVKHPATSPPADDPSSPAARPGQETRRSVPATSQLGDERKEGGPGE